MRVLFIDGEDELDAMLFERRFPDLDDVAVMVAEKGGAARIEDAGGEYAVELSIKEFGEVDPEFISWFCDVFVDYDATKGRNFHILQDDKAGFHVLRGGSDE